MNNALILEIFKSAKSPENKERILSKEREKLTYFKEINFRGNVPLEVTKIIGFYSFRNKHSEFYNFSY